MSEQDAPRKPFTALLWEGIADIYQAIRVHPFIRGLADGSLERESFRFYVIQDALYLREYARALALAASKGPGEAEIKLFCEHATGALEVERALHETFFRDFGLGRAEIDATPLAPTTQAYTDYLLAVAHGRPFPEVLGALLPCYWIYWEVGKELGKRSSPEALYRRWIETYESDAFAGIVRAVLELTDRVGEELGAREQRLVAGHFRTTSRYEWMFWEMGYRREAWPV